MRESEKKIARIAGIPYTEVEHEAVEKSKRLIDIIRQPNYAKRFMQIFMFSYIPAVEENHT